MKITDREKEILQEALDAGYTKIKRSFCGAIIFTDGTKDISNSGCFDSLFPFIHDEEEYSVKELLKGEV